jgi:hypothetical protein
MGNLVGEFRRSSYCTSGGCEVAQLPDGSVAVRDSKNVQAPPQVYSRQEWSDFIRAAKAGEFDFGPSTGAGLDSATVRFSR